MARFHGKWSGEIIVDAFRLPARGEDVPEEFFSWCMDVGFAHWLSGYDESIDIIEADGSITTVEPEQWIVKGIDGHFRACDHIAFIGAFEPEGHHAEAEAT